MGVGERRGDAILHNHDKDKKYGGYSAQSNNLKLMFKCKPLGRRMTVVSSGLVFLFFLKNISIAYIIFRLGHSRTSKTVTQVHKILSICLSIFLFCFVKNMTCFCWKQFWSLNKTELRPAPLQTSKNHRRKKGRFIQDKSSFIMFYIRSPFGPDPIELFFFDDERKRYIFSEHIFRTQCKTHNQSWEVLLSSSSRPISGWPPLI